MKQIKLLLIIPFLLLSTSCLDFTVDEESPRLVMFVGVDVSGSFKTGEHFQDSLTFLSHYIDAHLQGFGDLQKPHSLFVGSIGGKKADEAKTMYPIQVFEGKSIEKIKTTLKDIFKDKEGNPYTDFNSYFKQVKNTVKNRKLILKPISVVLISDGQPDVPGKGKKKYKNIELNPLENLSRNVTVRLLYTDADTGDNWQNQVPRRRVKVWTQDKEVMKRWNESNVIRPDKDFAKQDKFFEWVSENVDFPVRSRRVD